MATLVKADIEKAADPVHAHELRNARANIFLGVRVPIQRKIAKKHRNISLKDIIELLRSEIHEHRQTALYILVGQFKRADQERKKEIVNLYLENLCYINNWDLVDSSAYKILGAWLLDKPREILYRLARSDNLWVRRISVISTMTLIENGEFTDAISLAEIFLRDKEPPIHKATGWILRVVGKKDEETLVTFLDEHHMVMPRIMLRYATEKLPKTKRDYYLTANKHKDKTS